MTKDEIEQAAEVTCGVTFNDDGTVTFRGVDDANFKEFFTAKNHSREEIEKAISDCVSFQGRLK